jgi:hypothetical protein
MCGHVRDRDRDRDRDRHTETNTERKKERKRILRENIKKDCSPILSSNLGGYMTGRV